MHRMDISTVLPDQNTMEELLTRIWEMLIGREHGPLGFRVIIQPMVATFLAIRAGLRDA
jgi:hypothetical protein